MRLVQIGYVLGFAFILSLLLVPKATQAQGFGVSTGYRATPALPVIAFPVLNVQTSGIGGQVGGGALAVGGNAGGTNVSGSVSTSIMTLDLGSFFPNHGQIIGLPPPTFMPPLNNYLYDTTGAPWAIITAFGLGGGVGVGGVVGGGGATGMGGLGMGGLGGAGGGGFSGKGFGGFNGKKPL